MVKESVRSVAEEGILRFIQSSVDSGRLVRESSIVYELKEQIGTGTDVGLAPPDISQLVAGLIERGFISRVPSDNDEVDRSFRLVLSPSGRLRAKVESQPDDVSRLSPTTEGPKSKSARPRAAAQGTRRKPERPLARAR